MDLKKPDRWVDVQWAIGGWPDDAILTTGVVNDVLNTRIDSGIAEDKLLTLSEAKKKIENWIRIGHTSVVEHFVFSFRLSMSRVASHQIVRHRIASYTQKTMRIERSFTEDDFVIPPQITAEHLDEWISDMIDSAKKYDRWLAKGYSIDVARRMIPAGFRTGMRMTINARSLRNFFELRLTDEADFEIREVARRMLLLLYEKGFGYLFDDLKSVIRLKSKLAGL